MYRTFATCFLLVLLIQSTLVFLVYADETTTDYAGNHIKEAKITQYNPESSSYDTKINTFHSQYGGEEYSDYDTAYFDSDPWTCEFILSGKLNATLLDLNFTLLDDYFAGGLQITGDISYANPMIDYALYDSIDENGFFGTTFYSYVFGFDAANETATAEFTLWFYNTTTPEWELIDTWYYLLSSYDEPAPSGGAPSGSHVETFEDGVYDLNWTETEAYNGNLTIMGGDVAYRGDYGLNMSLNAGANFDVAKIALNITEFSGETCYIGFRINVVESKCTIGNDARIAAINSLDDAATFIYLEIDDNGTTNHLWEVNNVETSKAVVFDTWHWCVIGYSNASDGWQRFWIDGELVYNNTQDLSGFTLGDNYVIGNAISFANAEFECWFDDIVISGLYPSGEFVGDDLSLFFIGISGVILLVSAPSWFAFALRRGIRSADMIIQRFIFSLILFIVGYSMIVIWLGAYL